MYAIILAFVFVIGLIFGSFLNACIYRIPNNIKISVGFSMCPSCKKRLYWYELIPVLSYAVQGGKCRGCKQTISPKYPFVELLNALLYLVAFYKFGFSLYTLTAFVFISTLICVIFIDFEHMIIPDCFSVIIAIAGFGVFCLPIYPKLSQIAGIFLISVPFLLIALVTDGNAMGGGDIKLMAAVGLYLGWQSTLVCTFIALVTGGIYAIYKMITIKDKSKRQMPLGPFLAIGAIISLYSGSDIFNWYTGLLK